MTDVQGHPPDTVLDAIGAVLENLGSLHQAVHDRTTLGSLDRLYEDPHAVVGIAVFESTQDLIDGWFDAQDDLSRVMSRAIPSTDSKAWDGYLVLATARVPSAVDAVDLAHIRADTRRLRKLVITGDDLGHGDVALRGGVRRSLAPLLPLALPHSDGAADPISGLPDRVSVPGLSAEDIRLVVDAFQLGVPPLQTLHNRLANRRPT